MKALGSSYSRTISLILLPIWPPVSHTAAQCNLFFMPGLEKAVDGASDVVFMPFSFSHVCLWWFFCQCCHLSFRVASKRKRYVGYLHRQRAKSTSFLCVLISSPLHTFFSPSFKALTFSDIQFHVSIVLLMSLL